MLISKHAVDAAFLGRDAKRRLVDNIKLAASRFRLACSSDAVYATATQSSTQDLDCLLGAWIYRSAAGTSIATNIASDGVVDECLNHAATTNQNSGASVEVNLIVGILHA